MLGVLAASVASARTIHVFNVFCSAYTGDAADINKSVQVDKFIVDETFREHVYPKAWGVTLLQTEILGKDATKTNILQRFKKFSQDVKREDTIYIHFSGHGIIPDRTNNLQFLVTCDMTTINRTKWAEAIAALPCRLKIFVTDCCSSSPDHELAEGDEEVKPWNNIYYLLMEHTGFVNITAALPGQVAYSTNRGGYLTVNLHSDMQRFRKWSKVFRATQHRVLEETSLITRDYAKMGPQKPMAYSLAKPSKPLSLNQVKLPVNFHSIIADSNKRPLLHADLQKLGLQQLYFARNEIMARHGYDFDSMLLERYFSTLPWYRKRVGFKSPKLSSIESKNAALILRVEKSKGGPFYSPTGGNPNTTSNQAPPDIFCFSSQQPLPRTAIESLSLKQLSIARNEIYARHGYPFSSVKLQLFFKRKPYYRRNEDATNPALNMVEQQNVWLIKKIERIKGGAYRWK